MRMHTRRVADTLIQEYVREFLTQRGEESISWLVQSIRDKGYSFPTNHSQAMDEFERLGFKLRSDRNEYGSLLRTYVRGV